MKKCEKCGKEFEDSVQTCDTCGGALAEESEKETEEKTFCIYCGGEIAAGDYAAAYKKAEPEEKKAVLEENLVAVLCADVKENLKDPDSFDLRTVRCDLEKGHIVMKVGGKNSYGGVVFNYWYYEFDEDEKKYELVTSVSDLGEEKIYTYLDDADEKLEKMYNNYVKGEISELLDKKDIGLDDAAIDRINALNKEDLLDDVVLIDEVKELYPTEGNA